MKIAVIIPAYNEEQTVGDVVRACRASTLVDEVIVVSDASLDATARVAREAGARVIENKHNLGKAPTMQRGVSATDADIIMFADADLRGFTSRHVDMLIRPVARGRAGMCIGLRDRSRLYRLIGPYLFKVSGERALKREIFDAVDQTFMQGFMIEPALNATCKALGYRLQTVIMKGVGIRKKYEKVPWLTAIRQYLGFVMDVIRAMYHIKRHGTHNIKTF